MDPCIYLHAFMNIDMYTYTWYINIHRKPSEVNSFDALKGCSPAVHAAETRPWVVTKFRCVQQDWLSWKPTLLIHNATNCTKHGKFRKTKTAMKSKDGNFTFFRICWCFSSYVLAWWNHIKWVSVAASETIRSSTSIFKCRRFTVNNVPCTVRGRDRMSLSYRNARLGSWVCCGF